MRYPSFLPALAAVVLLSACSADTTPARGDDNEPTPAAVNVDLNLDDDSSSSESSAAVADSPEPSAGEVDATGARIIEMTSDDWSFAPNTLQLAQGEKVVVRLTNLEGDHSFAIPDLGLNVPVPVGETKDIVIPTDTAGTFQFRCRIPCGDGHRDMVGTIVIG